jgi:hypothetical protein
LAAPRITPPRLLLLVAAVLVVAGLAACGSSSDPVSTTGSAAAQQPGARRGIFSDPKVQACLKKAGVKLPQFGRGNGRPQGGGSGQPPSGGSGQPPGGGSGQPPGGGSGQPGNGQRPPGGGFRDAPEFQKLRDALQKCGVTLPNRPRPQQQTTTPDTTNS